MRVIYTALVIGLAGSATAAAQTQPPAPATFNLRVAGPTYFTNGEVKGASATNWSGRLGEATTVFVHSGRSLCEMTSPMHVPGSPYTSRLPLRPAPKANANDARVKMLYSRLLRLKSEPTGPGFGWQVDILPREERDGVLIVAVTWARLWNAGIRIPNGATNTAVLTLRPGTTVLLDRISADAAADGSCQAIGLGLEVGLSSAGGDTAALTLSNLQKVGPETIETELWLVQRLPNGTEQSQREVRRVLLGEVGRSAFPRTADGLDVSVEWLPIRIASGRIDLKLRIDRRAAGSLDLIPRSATAGFAFTAGPEDVMSFPITTTGIPKIEIPNAVDAAALSLRLRSKQVH